MTEYDNENQLDAVAQSCRHFSSGRLSNSRYNTVTGNISCRACKNWNGTKCVTDSFDNVLTSMEREE